MQRDNNPDRLDDGARAEAEMKEREAGYCTDCESHVTIHNGRCGCGSGRVITALPAPQGDDGLEPLYAFFRRGHMFHIHNDRSVFEGWMEKQAWLYPPDECEIVKYLPVIAPSEQAERVPADWYASANEARNAAEAKLASAMEALERIERIISYPISSEIKERGFDVRTDDDTISYAVEFIRSTLSRLEQGEKGGGDA